VARLCGGTCWPAGGADAGLESAWSNGKPAYRCRHGHTSAASPGPARPKNTYVREDQILPHLAAISILLAGVAGKPGRGNRGPAQVTGPADAAGLIDQLRADGMVLTYDPLDRTLRAADHDAPAASAEYLGSPDFRHREVSSSTLEGMSTPRIRLTIVIMDILDVLMNAPPDDPAWGLRLCEQTGHGSGTIYPALDRLMKAGWIEDRWEDLAPADRPRRRFYDVTSAGRAQYVAALQDRATRRMTWVRPALRTGGTT
jgi:DNA-binding MarR family transcriptional regulator